MPLEKQPFRMYQDEESISKDKAKSYPISIRLNAEEQEVLRKLKKMFNLHTDGTAIKLSMKVGYNVLHGFLGTETMSYLTSTYRRREP